ncbi:MAG: MYXO-CTERM sorting domain-containing protein [Myxococcota bacterium]
MVRALHRRAWQAAVAAILLARCGATSCSCVEPLTGPFPEDKRTDQLVQARITPEGFSFIGQKLPTVVSAFMQTACDGATGMPCASGQTCRCPDGETCDSCPAANPACNLDNPKVCHNAPNADPKLGFRIPPSDGEDTDICTEEIGANYWNCIVYATLKTTQLVPATASTMDIRVVVDLSSPPDPNGIKIRYDPWWYFETNCTVYPHIENRTVTGKLTVGREPRTDRATFEVTSVDVPFSGDDITIDGGFSCDIADIGFVKDWIVGSFAGDLGTTLKDALNEALDPVRTQACTPYASGYQCPAKPGVWESLCYTDGKCHFTDGNEAPIPGLLGVEGQVDLAANLPSFLAGNGDVQFSVFAGGTREGGANAAHFSNNGLNVGLVGGANADDNPCVPPRNGGPINVSSFDFPATVAPANGGSASTYMVGMAAHDALLGEMLGEAYSAGLLCQEISSYRVGLINSGIVGLLLGEGDAMAALYNEPNPAPRPAIMELRPREPPEAQIGLGTTAPDPDDPTRTILDQPLLTLSVPNLDINIYVLVEDRYVRLVTLNVDLAVGLGLEINGQGQVHVIANPVDTWLREVRARNADALNQTEEEIAQAVPELLAAFLPQFAPDLDQTFDLPSMRGFELQRVRFKGMENGFGTTAFGHTRYEFLGVFADLAFDAAAANASTLRVQTVASLERMEIPTPAEMSVSNGAARKRIKAILRVDSAAPGNTPVEHSYRVDNGLWHPYRQGTELVVSDVELNLQGAHTIQVRSRVVDAPGTLDETPVIIPVLSDAEAPRLQVSRTDDTLRIIVWDRVAEPEDIHVRYRVNDIAWIDVDGETERSVDLDDVAADAFIEVEARDQAGHVALSTLGERAKKRPIMRTGEVGTLPVKDQASTTTRSSNGCSSTAVQHGLPTGVMVLALAALLVRRRRP